MGQLFTRLIGQSDEFEVVASLDSRSPLNTMLEANSDLVVDVTGPAVSPGVVDFAIAHSLPILVGTSGWSATRIASLKNKLVAERSDGGVLIVPNFSIGSVLATTFAAMAARFYDSIEIVEAHHPSKVDSPSGTAVRTAELIGNSRAALGPVIAPHADQRARGQQVSSVPIHSLRMQGVVAKQDVIFGGTGETLVLSHETLDQSAYEAGIMLALRAVREVTGVMVGLENLINFGPTSPTSGPQSAPADLR